MICASPIPRGPELASCGDSAPPPIIDVAQLSIGLPDGVYYAGRQRTPWMTYQERSELDMLRYRYRHDYPRDNERLAKLMARKIGQSVVVKWEICGGLPSMPRTLENPYTDGLGEDTDARAFTWNSGSADEYTLPHCLLNDAFMGLEYRHCGVKRRCTMGVLLARMRRTNHSRGTQ